MNDDIERTKKTGEAIRSLGCLLMLLFWVGIPLLVVGVIIAWAIISSVFSGP